MMKKDKTPLAAWQSQYHTSTPPKVITFQIKVFNSCKEHMSGQKQSKSPVSISGNNSLFQTKLFRLSLELLLHSDTSLLNLPRILPSILFFFLMFKVFIEFVTILLVFIFCFLSDSKTYYIN